MAAQFGSETPILYARAKTTFAVAQRRDGRLIREAIAVPAWAWEVVVPVGTQPRLDPLQRAVLGLAQCDIVEASKLAKKLAIDPDLAVLVLADLQGRGWLDQHGEVTSRGSDALEDDAEARPQPEVRFVLQDPWTLDLWPRTPPRLDLVEPTQDGGPMPVLDLGTVGKPRTIRPNYLMPAAELRLKAPSREEVREATRRHMRAAHDVGAAARAVGSSQEIAIVDANPLEIWVVTDIYVPDEAAVGRRWRVADPFGLGDLDFVRRLLRDADAAKRIKSGGFTKLLDRLLGDSAAVDPDEAAEAALEAKFGAVVREWPELLEDLVRIEIACAQLQEDKDEKRRKRASDVAAIAVGRILDFCLNQLLKPQRWAVARSWKSAANSGATLAEILHSIHPDILIPFNWTKRMANGCNLGNDVNDLLILTALAAAAHANHPLRRWIGSEPGHLLALDRLRFWRNDAAHIDKEHHFHDALKNLAVFDEILERLLPAIT